MRARLSPSNLSGNLSAKEMSAVALATMDAAYGLNRLGLSNHQPHLQSLHLHSIHHQLHHRGTCSPNNHASTKQEHEVQREEQCDPLDASPLRFSVVNILRPDFGRSAILGTRLPTKAIPIKVTPLPVHSPLALPRDLSISSASRLSPHSPPIGLSAFSGSGPRSEGRDAFCLHNGLASPLQRHSSSLSRSGSLESLASNRSSVTSISATGTASVSSAASTTGTESVSGDSTGSGSSSQGSGNGQSLWPAWIYCTRYSDRPSSGPRTRRVKRSHSSSSKSAPEEKRPRTAFSGEQLGRLKDEFAKNKYLNEQRRQKLSQELGLNEQQIKIWFQNKRAKIKKSTGQKNPLALQLMAQGLYNHSTVPVDEDDEEISR